MKGFVLGVILAASLPAVSVWADAGQIVAAEDGCQINRGQDQIKPIPGAGLQIGDVIKCLGRTHAKAFLSDNLVLFGPLSETRISSASPLTLELAKGTLRVISEPGGRETFSIKTPKSLTTSQQGDVAVRYNASSEFSEIVVIDGSATATNTLGATGSVTLNAKESSLLSPESTPTQPSVLQPNEIRDYTKDTEYSQAPLANGDLFKAIEPTMKRIDSAYAEARRQLARPSSPENAPFRSLDSRREAFPLPQFDQPGRDVAPGGANIDFKWTFQPPTVSGGK
jgi:hypothetical protein